MHGPDDCALPSPYIQNLIEEPMSNEIPVRLSDVVEQHASTRREFIAKASALSLVIPGVGAALAACSPEQQRGPDSTRASSAPPANDAARHTHNSDSKLDSSLLKGNHAGSSVTGAAAGSNAEFHRFDPVLPPLKPSPLKLHFHAKEAPVRISEDTVVAGWTFDGDIPGPVVHCRVGDTIEFTLTNDVDVPHSMDFHAAQIDPKTAFRLVPKGESV